MERVDGDVALLATLLSAAGPDLFGSALLTIGLVAALWHLSGGLGLAFGTATLAAVIGLEAIRRRAVPSQVRSRSADAAFFGAVAEGLQAAEDLKAHAAVQWLLGRLRAHLGDWRPVYVQAERGGYAVWIWALVAFGLLDGIAYGFGAGLYLRGTLTLGSIYAIVAYAALAARPLGSVRQRLEELQGADAAISRLRLLLAEKSPLAPGAAAVPRGPLDLEFAAVHFRYPDGAGEDEPPALTGCSFRLAAGRRLGVIGRSGAGKSTLLRLAMRLYDPQSGQVRWDGRDAQAFSLEALRRAIGYVPQEVRLFTASLRDNITLFDDAVPDAVLCENVAALGLGAWLERKPGGLNTLVSPGSLSAGEAQLIALLRLLHRDVGVVLLDEVSSRLDPDAEALLTGAIEHLLQGRTALVVAHRPHTLERMDDILVLQHGQVVEFGASEDLLRDRSSLYSRFRLDGFRKVLA